MTALDAQPAGNNTAQQPLPEGRIGQRQAPVWRWSQTWRNVLFVHWQVPTDRVRDLLPGELELDCWQGSAWVSAVAFQLAMVRLGRLPPIPWCTDFLELNLRTYVRYRSRPGICFLSMHADSRAAVAAARWLTPLPYRYAPMACARERGQWRWRCGGAGAAQPALLEGKFQVRGEAAPAVADSLDAWLLERYDAFVSNRRGALYRMTVEHPPWRVSPVTCDIASARCEASIGIPLSRVPSFSHFSTGVEALLSPFEPLG